MIKNVKLLLIQIKKSKLYIIKFNKNIKINAKKYLINCIIKDDKD